MTEPLESTQPGGLETKLARACDTCRRRKVRCSGIIEELGKCINCSKHQIECTFLEGTRKRGPPRGYVEELEKRVASLEGQLRRVSHSSGSSPSATSPGSDGGATKVPLCTDEDEIVEQMRQWNLSGHYHGRSSLSSLFTSFDALRNRATGKPHELETHLTFAKAPPSFIERLFEVETLQELQAHPLPEPDLVQDLVALYFDRVNVIIPLLHRASFERNLASGLATSSASFRSLVFAVMACGSRYSEDARTLHMYPWIRHPQGDPPEKLAKGYSFLFAALKLVFTMAPTSLFTLQSLTLSCEYIVQAGSALIGWTLIGWTARMMITSGAHCLINAGWNDSFMVDELRKRCFWHFYALDRSMSLNMGRPFALPDDIIDVDLPLDIDDATLEYYDRLTLPFPRTIPMAQVSRKGNVEVLRQLAQLSRLFERVVEVLYTAHPPPDNRSDIAALESVLNQWLEQLPKELRWSPAEPDDNTVTRSGIVLCAFYGCLMSIHRSAIRPQSKATLDRCLPKIQPAAVNLSHILDTYRTRQIATQSWMYTLPNAIQAGMLLLIGAYAKETLGPLDEQVDGAVKRLIGFLASIGELSWGAARCAMLLQKAYDRFIDDLAGPETSTNASFNPMADLFAPTRDNSTASTASLPNSEMPLSPGAFNGLLGANGAGSVDFGLPATDLFGSASGPSSSYDFASYNMGPIDWLAQLGLDPNPPPATYGENRPLSPSDFTFSV